MSLQRAWYLSDKQAPWWLRLFIHFELLFGLVARIRKSLYSRRILHQYKSSLPVVIVGNISVGGNGKTPLVLALASYFSDKGIRCAVLSRGYGGSQTEFPFLLSNKDMPEVVGDEPALICQRLNIPVVIDPKRARGAQFIEANTDAQIIICDDGLQHYALGRDIELCVMDSRGVGNGRLLPRGPLREPAKRLNSVDWIVLNGKREKSDATLNATNTPVTEMQLVPHAWINVKSGETLDISSGVKKFSASPSVIALAGIGDPKRFFNTLQTLNIKPDEAIALPDHYKFSANDLPNADVVLMTEKDAVKCRGFASDKCWYLQVNAQIDDVFYQDILQKIANKNANFHEQLSTNLTSEIK